MNKRALLQVIFCDGLVRKSTLIHKIAENVIKIYFDDIILYILLIIVYEDE